jgi:NTE family protein
MDYYFTMLEVDRFSLVSFVLILFSALSASEVQPEKIIIKPTFSPLETSLSNPSYSLEPGIGLAVSGGGARGLALIGILKIFEREQIKVNFISGVSMGGIIGGLYSCGYSPEEIEKIAHEVDWSEILSQSPLRSTLLTTQKGQSEKSLFRIRFQGWRPVIPRAITSAQNLNQLLEKLTSRAGIRPNISFDYLDPPLRIVCTDLLSGDRVVISSGNIGEAMRASVAIPVAFTPVEIGGQMLVDGGLVDPIPVSTSRDAVGSPVVAVDMSSELKPASGISDVVDIADQTTTIMTMDKKFHALALADYCIKPDLAGFDNTDFSKIEGLIAAGEEAAAAAALDIKKLIERLWSQPGDSQVFNVSTSEVSGLNTLPRTFFVSGFQSSPTMNSTLIEANLKEAYGSGYLADAWAEVLPDSGGCTLVYHLVDNPRIKSAVFKGATLFDNDTLYGLIESREGTVLNSRTVARDRRIIENHYIGSGYSLVRVAAEFDSSTGALSFEVDEGVINDIEIEGAKRTRRWVIMRHVPFKVGEIFVQAQAERAIDDVYGTGLFETAKLIANPDSTGITLSVKVVEKPYNFIRGGARYDLEYNAKAFVDLVADNFLGDGQEIYISTTIGEKKRSISFHLITERVLKTLFTNSLAIDYSEFKRNHYVHHEYSGYHEQNSYGVLLTPGRLIPQLGTIYLVGLLRHIEWYEPGRPDQQEFNKLGLGIRSIVDSRDALSFPEKGKYHYFELEFASDIRDEKTYYTRFETTLEAYYRLTKRLNFHPRINIGASSAIMPYFDEFSLGGLRSFMGLYDDEYLGDKTAQGSVELRNKIGDRFYVMARYDIGDIWSKLESIKLSKLCHGVGFGMGLKTPFGPIQGWYGRTDTGLDALYLNIGYEW